MGKWAIVSTVVVVESGSRGGTEGGGNSGGVIILRAPRARAHTGTKDLLSNKAAANGTTAKVNSLLVVHCDVTRG